MKSHVRAAVAAVALSDCTAKDVHSVYFDGCWLNIEVEIKKSHVIAYDYTNSCHIDGTLPGLYHYGEGCHIELRRKTMGKYDGFDFKSGSQFEVTVKGRNAEIYDYTAGDWFSFST